MRTPKGYTTKEQIENYLLITIDPSFDDQVADWIAKIESYIDSYTERNFKADSMASVRLYDGSGTGEVIIDDCVSIEKVEYGTETPFSEIEEYITYPANAAPKTKIARRYSVFPCGKQNVRITAKWGYSVEVPADIEFIATIFAAGVINYSLHADGEVSSMNVGRYSVSFKDEKQWQDFERASKLLELYRRYR